MTDYTFQQFLHDQISEKANGNRSAFADLIKVSKSTVTRLLDKENPRRPELETLERISNVTGTDLIKLIHLAYPDGVENIPSPTAQVVADRFDKLPEDIKTAMLALMRGATLRR